MHDGQNLFDPQTSFIRGRTWQMREHADAAIEAGEVEPLIIVGIYNTGDRRIAEYTHDRDWQRGGGEAENYGRLIVDELMPFIARHYRVRSGRELHRPRRLARSAAWSRSILASASRSTSASSPCSRPASGGITRASSAT